MWIRSKTCNGLIDSSKVKEIVTCVTSSDDTEKSWIIIFDNVIEWNYNSSEDMMADFNYISSLLANWKEQKPKQPPAPIERQTDSWY